MNISHPVPARLIDCALTLLASGGETALTTRAVCGMAGVTAPTLYHHFGTLDGLLNAALERAFGEFLAMKQAPERGSTAVEVLMAGWDDYVGFAAARPGLYAAMIARVLKGAEIPAATAARAILMQRVKAVAAERRLAMPPDRAADMIWASAHAAAMLHVMPGTSPPDAATLEALRQTALAPILSES